jgi:hypothetical protein
LAIERRACRHAAALRAGARHAADIHGADYYAAFIIDPEDYRIEAYHYGPGER